MPGRAPPLNGIANGHERTRTGSRGAVAFAGANGRVADGSWHMGREDAVLRGCWVFGPRFGENIEGN